MTRKVRIVFPDVSKTNEFTHCKILESAWQKQFDKWKKEDTTIFVIAYFENDPSANGFGRATRVGDLKAVSLDFPTLTFEGELFTDDPLVLSNGFDFHIENELKCEDFDFSAFTNQYKIVSMEINQLVPSPVPTYPSIIEYLSDDLDEVVPNPDSDESCMRCPECKEPFEAFEYIVKYRGNYYHESCFLELAIGILQAKQIHLDSKGTIDEQEDEPYEYEEDRYF